MERVRPAEGISRRIAPAGGHFVAELFRQRGKELAIAIERQWDAGSTLGMRVRWTGLQQLDEIIAGWGKNGACGSTLIRRFAPPSPIKGEGMTGSFRLAAFPLDGGRCPKG